MTTTTRAKRLSDLLIHELGLHYATDNVTLSGGNFALGTVVAKHGGKYVALVPGAADDTAVAVAVVKDNIDAFFADATGPVLSRGAVVFSTGLVWPAGITDVQKAAAIAQLTALTVVVRDPA